MRTCGSAGRRLLAKKLANHINLAYTFKPEKQRLPPVLSAKAVLDLKKKNTRLLALALSVLKVEYLEELIEEGYNDKC